MLVLAPIQIALLALGACGGGEDDGESASSFASFTTNADQGDEQPGDGDGDPSSGDGDGDTLEGW